MCSSTGQSVHCATTHSTTGLDQLFCVIKDMSGIDSIDTSGSVFDSDYIHTVGVMKMFQNRSEDEEIKGYMDYLLTQTWSVFHTS